MGEMADLALEEWDPDDPDQWMPRRRMGYTEFVEYARIARHGQWRTRDGRKLWPRDMDTRHLRNTIAWLGRMTDLGHYEYQIRELWVARMTRALNRKMLFPESRYPRR